MTLDVTIRRFDGGRWAKVSCFGPTCQPVRNVSMKVVHTGIVWIRSQWKRWRCLLKKRLIDRSGISQRAMSSMFKSYTANCIFAALRMGGIQKLQFEPV